MRTRHMLTGLIALALVACQDKPPNVTILQLERGGSIDFVCLCEQADGSFAGALMEECDPEAENTDCTPYALVLQTNRGEIAVVDLRRQRLHDSDDRAPFTTFPQVGDFPSDLAVTSDGTRVYVVHVGEPTLAIVDATSILGPTLPDPAFVDLPAPAESIALTQDGTRAFVTLPSIHSLAVVDLEADPPAVESFVVGPEPVPVEEEPEPSPDADADPDVEDGSDDVIEEDVVEDLPEDVPGEEAPPDLPALFMPLEVMVLERADPPALLVSGFDTAGGGGVLEMDLASLLAGEEPSAALSAVHLEGVPIGPFDVVVVEEDGEIPDQTEPGFYLYAANRDEEILHVVDLETGEVIPTSGGNPLVTRDAMRTDGLVTDVLAVHLEEEDLPEEVEPLSTFDFNGDFVFLVTSVGVVEAVDVYDRICWLQRSRGEDLACTPHVIRNFNEEEESYPRWPDPPALGGADGESLAYDEDNCPGAYGTPCFVDTEETFETPFGEERTFGIFFFALPGETVPDVRRPRSEIWSITWEGKIPWTTGIGGNLSELGDTLTDVGMPFCAYGVRAGDVLVIDDGPDPIDTEAPCDDYPAEGGMAYRITDASQSDLVFEQIPQWSAEEGAADTWLAVGYSLPTEECFPFAVKYHVRTSGQWTVSGSTTGFLHSTVLDTGGRCVDDLPACASWEEEGCTLLTGRADAFEPFVNPYIRFEINDENVTWPPDDFNSIMRPGLGFTATAVSGFQPLAVKAATLPDSIEWFEYYGTFVISDRAWDGVLEFDPDTFHVVYEYN